MVKGQEIQKKEQKGNSLVVSLFLSHLGKYIVDQSGVILGDVTSSVPFMGHAY